MEPLDDLWEGGVEEDFIALMENDFPQDMFLMSAKTMLGEEWLETAKQILEDADRQDLMEKLSGYADENPTEED